MSKLDYNILKKSGGKTIKVKKGSIDAFKLREIYDAIGGDFCDLKNSKFESNRIMGSRQITNGFVLFNNGCKVEVV